MQRYFFWVASLILAGFILGACGSTTAEPTAVPPTEPPAESSVQEISAEPTPEPTAVPPTETPTESSAQETSVEPISDVVEVSGPLTVLCGMQEDQCQAAVAAFEAETGIETSMVRMSSGEALARLRAEGDDTLFDVWYGGPSLGPGAAVQEGLIEPYIPENSKFIPDELKDPDGNWTGIYVGALGFCSNAEYLAELGVEAPTSWDDLLDPALEQNIAMADQRTSGTAVTAGGTLVALMDGEDGALEYLKALDKNIFQYTKSGSSPGRMTASGEVAVSVIFSHDCVKFAQETGVDLITSLPEEGTGYEIGQVSLIAAAKNPKAGKVFIEWTLTPAAQEIGAQTANFQIPTNPDAQVPPEAIKLDQVVLAEGFTPELVEELRAGGFPDRFAAEVREGVAAPE
jgi:iron(III) transport system substrate-binding protein